MGNVFKLNNDSFPIFLHKNVCLQQPSVPGKADKSERNIGNFNKMLKTKATGRHLVISSLVELNKI